jgi:hypothetical protein
MITRRTIFSALAGLSTWAFGTQAKATGGLRIHPKRRRLPINEPIGDGVAFTNISHESVWLRNAAIDWLNAGEVVDSCREPELIPALVEAHYRAHQHLVSLVRDIRDGSDYAAAQPWGEEIIVNDPDDWRKLVRCAKIETDTTI